jgi:hypothetical protein
MHVAMAHLRGIARAYALRNHFDILGSILINGFYKALVLLKRVCVRMFACMYVCMCTCMFVSVYFSNT